MEAAADYSNYVPHIGPYGSKMHEMECRLTRARNPEVRAALIMWIEKAKARPSGAHMQTTWPEVIFPGQK